MSPICNIGARIDFSGSAGIPDGRDFGFLGRQPIRRLSWSRSVRCSIYWQRSPIRGARKASSTNKLPHVLLFSILAIISGSNSYRGIVTFIDVHRRRLNRSFGLKWRRAPSHTAIRYILQGLDPAAVEAAFRRHAAQLQAARAKPGTASIALDGKTLRGSFDRFHDRTAAHVLSAFATDTKLVLAHVDIGEKSSEIPAAQALLAEMGIAEDAIVTLDALHCQKKPSTSPRRATSASSSRSRTINRR